MAVIKAGGGEGASPLEKFQQLRDLAKKKLDGEESRAKLSDLVRRKQELLGMPGAAQAAASAGAKRAEADGESARPTGTARPPGTAGYGRSGAPGRADPKPGLGRFIDIMV